jgi:hypothetical protein
LVAAVIGAVFVTLVTGALNTSPTARLVGAALGAAIPVLVAAGAQGIVVSGLITGGALLFTYGGFTIFDYASDKKATFPIPAALPSPADNGPSPITTTTDSLKLEVKPEIVTCDSDGCDEVIATNKGDGLVKVYNIEFVDDDAGEFSYGGDCAYESLQKDQSCQVSVTFTPSRPSRTVTLRIHHNVGAYPTNVPIEAKASGGPPPPTLDLVPAKDTVECDYQAGGALVDHQPKDALQIKFTLQLVGATDLQGGVVITARSSHGPSDPYERGGVGEGRYVALPLEPNDYRLFHTVTVKVDPNNEVVESNEHNNLFRVRVFVPTRPSSLTLPLSLCRVR